MERIFDEPPAPACTPLAAAIALVFTHNQSRKTDSSPELEEAVGWRKEHRLIDLHFHVAYENDKLDRAVEIMDRVGIGVAVNPSGDSKLDKDGKSSAFERNKSFADSRHPGRFAHYMNLDYSRWNEADFAEHAVRLVEEGHRLGAAGLKEYKRLDLYLKDNKGALITVDDPRLDPVWKRCGELDLPVSIHVADPVAFWLPYDSNNERGTELKDHRSWWFGDLKMFPPQRRLQDALNLVIERHPKITFVCVHFANDSEDLEWSSGFSAAIAIDQERFLWRTERRIPIKVLSPERAAKPGVLWRLNLYRQAATKRAFLGWNPTATGTAHTPARLGYLPLVGATPDGKTPDRGGSKTR
jgi:predicted TIM-barrel fold metal-dependent hydrolase